MPAPTPTERPANLRSVFGAVAENASTNVSNLSSLFTSFKENMKDGFQLSDLDNLFTQISALFEQGANAPSSTAPNAAAPSVAPAGP